MNKKKISAILVLALTINTIGPNLSVFAETTNINKVIEEKMLMIRNLKWIIPI